VFWCVNLGLLHANTESRQVPPFLVALKRVLPRKTLGFKSAVVSEERLRKASIRILGMVLASANHFGASPLPEGSPSLGDFAHYDPLVEKTIRKLYEASLVSMTEFCHLRPHIFGLLWQVLIISRFFFCLRPIALSLSGIYRRVKPCKPANAPPHHVLVCDRRQGQDARASRRVCGLRGRKTAHAPPHQRRPV